MTKKALVVDNNEVILKIITLALQKRGLKVETAKDGLSALQTLQHFHPDIIFTDLIMPNIDGENLCRIIKSRGNLPTPLLIIVSAMAVEEDLDFVDFGAHSCIAKGPASTMVESIDKVLSHVENGQIDLLKGERLGVESLIPRAIDKELLAEKHHYQRIFSNIDNGIIEFNSAGLIVYCNAYAAKLFGKTIVDILSFNLRELFSPTARQHVKECLDRFNTTRRTVESIRPIHVGNREIVFKFITLSERNDSTALMIIKDMTDELRFRRQLNDHLGHLENIVAERTKSYEEANRELQNSINERKKINEELEFVARQWSNTFDTISDFVSVHDKYMKLVRVNKALADFLGEEPENLLGRHCYEVMHARSEPWDDCPHLAAIEQGKTVTHEVNDKHIGFPLLVSCSPLMHDDGSLLGSVHVARDISEQKKAEALRENLISQLEESLAKVKLLSGFIPICVSCKKIRDDSGYWNQVEVYIRDHSEAEFSHSICPACAKSLYPDIVEKEE